MLKNGLYNLIGPLIGNGIAFASIPAIIYFMGIKEYGLFSLVYSVIGIALLAEAGLSISTTVFLSGDIGSENTDNIASTLTVCLGAMFFLATTVAILLTLQADRLVSAFPNLNPDEQILCVQGLRLSGGVIWARLLQLIFISLEQAYERYDLISLFNALQSGINSLGSIVVAWLGGNSVGLIGWQGITAIIILIAHGWIGGQLVPKKALKIVWNSDKSWSILHYSFMTWLSSLGGSLFAQGDRVVMALLFNPEVVGIYSVITTITRQINLFSALPVHPLLPKLSQNLQQDWLELRELIRQALQANGVIALGLGGTLFTLAPIVMSLMIPGTHINEYILPFRIAIVIYTIYSLNAVGYYILFAVHAVKISMIIQLTAGILSLLLIGVGGTRLGFLGAVAGNAGYCLTLIMVFVAMKKLKIPLFFWFSWLKLLIIWLAMVIIINYFIPDIYWVKIPFIVVQTLVIVKFSRSFIFQ